MKDARDLSNTTSDSSGGPRRPAAWRRLFPLLCLLLLAQGSVASAQTVATPTPSNPALTSCGLPAAGTVISNVTYSLTANCTLTDKLSFSSPAGTYTINGNGYSIGTATGFNGTLLEFASGSTLTLNDVTLDGSAALRAQLVGVTSSTATLNANRTTFVSSVGTTAAVSLSTTSRANLSNVLFDRNNSISASPRAFASALNLNRNAVAVVTNAVFRGNSEGSAAVANRTVAGSLTFNGCLSFSGNYPYNTSGTIIDNSSGECSGTLGNGGQVLPDPVAASCGLPTSGYLDHSTTFTLRGNCTQSGALVVSEGVSITIEGYGNVIRGYNPRNPSFIVAGNSNLTLRDLTFNETRIRNYGALDVRNVAFSGATNQAIVDYGFSTFEAVRFIGNIGGFAGALVSVDSYEPDQTTTIRDAIFRNNQASAGRATLVAYGGTIILNGCLTLDGNMPADFLTLGGTFTYNNIGPCEGLMDFPPPIPRDPGGAAGAASPVSRNADDRCNPHPGAPVIVYCRGAFVEIYAAVAHGMGVHVLTMPSIATLRAMGHPDGVLGQATHPTSAKRIVARWRAAESQIELSTWYEDMPPHQVDKPYIIRITTSEGVDIVAW